MEKKEIIIDNELDKVSGGSYANKSERAIGCYHLSGYVPVSQVEVGHRYYFADNNHNAWYESYVTKIYNKKNGCSTSKYYEVEEFVKYVDGKEVSSRRLVTNYLSDNYTVYKEMIKN